MLAAAVQMTSRADVGENLATCQRLVGEARKRGAELVVLPENFAFIGAHERDKFEVAEAIDPERPGRIVGALAEAAARHGVWVVGGGMPEQSGREGYVHNTCVVLDAQGKLRARYRKLHLFDVNIPGGAQFKESGTVAPGSEVVTVTTPWFELGLSICYDLRFPELYRRLTDAGARVVVVPAAFTLHTGKDHWHALLRARAIENQVWVVAPGQYGRSHENRVCYGHSLVVDPWGAVVAEVGDREGLALAEIDLPFQDKVRRELPCLEHRKL